MKKIKYKKLEKSLRRLKVRHFFLLSLKKRDIPKEFQEQVEESIRESVIKRFEFCYDSFWKSLSKYLETAGDGSLVGSSPKAIFRKAHEAGLIDQETLERLFTYIEMRIGTAHDYNEDKANEALEKIPDFIQDVEDIFKAISEGK